MHPNTSLPSPRGPLGRHGLVALFAFSHALSAAACAYDPPPEPSLVYSELGVYLEGEALEIAFTEPIDLDSLVVRLWEPKRTREGDLEATTPLKECRASAGACDGLTIVSLAEDRVGVTVAAEYAQPGKLGTIEVAAGLADKHNNATGVGYLFEYIYFPAGFASGGSVGAEYVPGHYLLRSPFEVAGIKVDLKLIVDIPRVDDTIALFGYVGEKSDAGPVPAPVEERICAVGKILSAAGSTFIYTSPVELKMTYSGIPIELKETAIFGTPTTDPETGLPMLKGALINKQVCLFGNTCLGGPNDPPNFAPFDAFFYEPGTTPDGVRSFCEEGCASPPPMCDAAAQFDCATFCPDP